MALSLDAILQAIDHKTISVDVPVWGGAISLRCMTGKQRNDYEFWATSQSKLKCPDYRGIRERLIVNCAVDENGSPLFTPADIDKLAEKNSQVIDRLHDECRALCGMDEDAVGAAEKN